MVANRQAGFPAARAFGAFFCSGEGQANVPIAIEENFFEMISSFDGKRSFLFAPKKEAAAPAVSPQARRRTDHLQQCNDKSKPSRVQYIIR